ncbi:MAG: MFS transporter [Dehalococcoidia bacterium]|nr:MFS transporter [Dehalococcoidia bacterium]
MINRPRVFYGWTIVAAALIMMAVGYALRNTFSVFYPVLVDEFGWERGNTALMFSINIIVYGVAAPFVGSLVDRFNPRIVFSIGACVMGSAIALCSLASQQWHFFLLYGVAAAIGLSMTGVTPLSAIIAKWFVRNRALAFGIFNMGFGISLLASPAAQSLISGLGRQQAYMAIGLIAIVIIVPIAVFVIRRSPADKGTFPDGVAPANNGSESGDVRVGKPLTQWMRTEWTLKRAMHTRQFWLLFAMDFCLMGLAQQILIAHSVYLFRDIGFTPQASANAFSLFGIGLTVGYLFAYLSDRIGREHVIIPGCLLSAASAAVLLLVHSPAQHALAFSCMFVAGAGMGAAITTFLATVADLFQGKNYGTIQGIMTVGFSMGGAFSPWLAGYLHDITGSYFVAIIVVVSALVLDAILVAVIAPRKLRPVHAVLERAHAPRESPI